MRGAFRHMISQRKSERPAEIRKQVVAVYGNVMNRQNVTSGAVNFPKEGLMFTTNKENVMTWFKGLAADFYDSRIQKLVPKLNKYLDNAGVYVEK